MQTPTKATAHSVYNLNYHIVFVTKYRNQGLTQKLLLHNRIGFDLIRGENAER